jgi:holdfast attachment protein HfaA
MTAYKTRNGKARALSTDSFAHAAGVVLVAATLTSVTAMGALAQSQNTSGEWNTPYGYSFGQHELVFQSEGRDRSMNRVVVDGRILLGEEASNLPRSLRGDTGPSFAGDSVAVGNQLNVIVSGNWNTVIVDSTQVNNGNVTAVTDLNGELDLDGEY